MQIKRFAALLLAGGSILAVPSIALAQAQPADDAQGDSEIIVTAQKRAENVQDVPISITVVSAAQLERRGTQSVQDLSQASASLEFTDKGGAPGGGGFVRGIGTASLGNTATSSVSVVLDQVVLGNLQGNDIFDVERVEVLKGPQGTLFGSSVSAGVLNIVTKAPRIGEKSIYVSSEFAPTALGSEYSRYAIRTAVNLPISDNAAVRIAGFGFGNKGLSHNTFTGADSDLDSYGFRGRLLVNVTDSLRFNLIADYSRNHEDNGSGFVYRFAPPGGPLEAALRACGVTASPDNVDNCGGFPRYFDTQVGGVSGQFDLDIGENTLTSISSYRERRLRSSNDIFNIAPAALRANGFRPISLISPPGRPQTSQQDQFTQELRLASPSNKHFEWVLGLFYQGTNRDYGQASAITLNFGAPTDLVITSNALVDTGSKDYAAFGNATYYLSDTTRLIAGLRVTHSAVSETKTDRNETFGSTVTGSQRTTDTAVTWRLGLQQDLGPDTMLYATVSTGYKPPEFNDSSAANIIVVRSERPTSFEVGIKQSLFDRRLFVNADIYYTRVKDFQTQGCVPDATVGIRCSELNVDRVVSKGAELEIFGRPFTGMTANFSAIYNDAKYPTGFLGADGTALQGNQLNYAPKFKMTASLEQEIPVSERYTLVLGGDATYRAKQSMYLSSLPQYVVPAQTLFNARIGIKSTDNWEFSLFARNLTDQVYPTALFPSSAFSAGGIWHFIDPNSRRVVGLQLNANF